jgi:hypothetical protein
MRRPTNSATADFSECTSGSEGQLSNVGDARRNTSTDDPDWKRILLRHHRYAGLRPSAEAPSR